MASINLSGTLEDPTTESASGMVVRFIQQSTTGNTVVGAVSVHRIPEDGVYNIDLNYGNVMIETQDPLTYKWTDQGVVTINEDTPATSIPALIGITTPATDADLLVFQALVADAELARDEAVAARNESVSAKDEIFDRLAIYQLASTDYLINTFDGSQLSVGEAVSTLGFLELDPEGGAIWMKTGNVVEASKTPAELGNGTLSDAAGNEYIYSSAKVTLEAFGWDVTGAVSVESVINAATAFRYSIGGGDVYASTRGGELRLDVGEIVIPEDVILIGSEHGITRASVRSNRPMPQFNVYMEGNEESPAIILRNASGIKGFSFYYPNQIDSDMVDPLTSLVLDEPKEYGWSITTYGDYTNNSNSPADLLLIDSIMLANSYKGIYLFRSGQSRINDIFGNPLKMGLAAEEMKDVCYLRTLHFWPFTVVNDSPLGRWIQANGTTIELANVDNFNISDPFSFGYNKGLSLVDYGKGGPWFKCSGGGFDQCSNPIVVEAIQLTSLISDMFFIGNDISKAVGVTTTNGSLANLTVNRATLTITNAKFWKMASSAIISSTDCTIVFINPVAQRGYNENSSGNDVNQWLICNEGNGTRVKIHGGTCRDSNPISGISGTTDTWFNDIKMPTPDYNNDITSIVSDISLPISSGVWTYVNGGDDCITETATGFTADTAFAVAGSLCRYPFPQEIKDECGLFVFECNLSVDVSLGTTGGFNFRIMTNDGNVAHTLLLPSSIKPMFKGEKISIPIVVPPEAGKVWFDLVLAEGLSVVSVDNMKLYRVDNSDKYNPYLDLIQGTQRWLGTSPNPLKYEYSKKMVYADAYPTSGIHTVGDKRINSDPTIESSGQWIYTDDGWVDETRVGNSGIVGDSVFYSGNADDAPIGSKINTETMTVEGAVLLNYPDIGVLGTLLCSFVGDTYGNSSRRVQEVTEIFGNGSSARGRTFKRVLQDATWYDWIEV